MDKIFNWRQFLTCIYLYNCLIYEKRIRKYIIILNADLLHGISSIYKRIIVWSHIIKIFPHHANSDAIAFPLQHPTHLPTKWLKILPLIKNKLKKKIGGYFDIFLLSREYRTYLMRWRLMRCLELVLSNQLLTSVSNSREGSTKSYLLDFSEFHSTRPWELLVLGMTIDYIRRQDHWRED